MAKEKGLVLSISGQLDVIDKKISQMKAIADSKWLTPGKITMLNSVVDIKTETSIEKLAMGFGNVLHCHQRLQEAYDKLGLNTYPVIRIDGGTVEEWEADIKLRIAIIDQKQSLDELQGLRKEWEDLMDKEDKKAILEEKMKKYITK